MRRSKSLLVTSGLGALLAFMGLAASASDMGVCPPYSKTFGPGSPPAEILAFISEINTRPGGGTLVLEPGNYEGILDGLSITGIVCIRSSSIESEYAVLYAPEYMADSIVLRLEPGAIFTTHLVGLFSPRGDSYWGLNGQVYISPGATLFASDGEFRARIYNDGSAYLADIDVRPWGIENLGMLVMRDGSISDVFFIFPDPGDLNHGRGLINRLGAYAFLERVAVSRNRCTEGTLPKQTYGFGIDNEGVLTLINSVVENNGINTASDEDCDEPPCRCGGTGIANSGDAYVVGSTIARQVHRYWYQDPCNGNGIANTGNIEVSQSIVAEGVEYAEIDDCSGPVTDLGYNVFSDDSCLITQETSIQADPVFLTDSVELSAVSPAIDMIPLELCPETDALGRPRTDGNGDGTVACDAGALEFTGQGVVVKSPPFGRDYGLVDLETDTALYVLFMSSAGFDPADVVVASVILDDTGAMPRGYNYVDRNGDGVPDLRLRYKLVDLPLDCGEQTLAVSATTVVGDTVGGELKLEVIGCMF